MYDPIEDDIEISEAELYADAVMPEGNFDLATPVGLGGSLTAKGYGDTPADMPADVVKELDGDEDIDALEKLHEKTIDERIELARLGYSFDFNTGEWSK